MRIENLPLFPLRVVLFPGMVLPLHIFEERYKQMVADCLSDDPRFGVALINRGREVGGGADVHEIGAIARIVRVGRYEDGRMDLWSVGLQRFRAVAYDAERPYLRATVELLDDADTDAVAVRHWTDRVRTLLGEYRAILGVADEDGFEPPEDPQGLSYLGGQLDLPLGEKQRMLESLVLAERLRLLTVALGREIALFRALGPTRPLHAHPGVGSS